jgi:hypothetical protein
MGDKDVYGDGVDYNCDEDPNQKRVNSPRHRKMFESFLSTSPVAPVSNAIEVKTTTTLRGSVRSDSSISSRTPGTLTSAPESRSILGQKLCRVRFARCVLAIAILSTCYFIALSFHKSPSSSNPAAKSETELTIADPKSSTSAAIRRLSPDHAIPSNVIVVNTTSKLKVVLDNSTAIGSTNDQQDVRADANGAVTASELDQLGTANSSNATPFSKNATQISNVPPSPSEPLESLHGLLGYACSTRRPLDAVWNNSLRDAVSPVVWNGYPTAAQVLSMCDDDTIGNGGNNCLSSKLFRAGFVVQPMWNGNHGSIDVEGDIFRQSVENVVVSGYFNMSSKYPQKKYLKWMTKFLSM